MKITFACQHCASRLVAAKAHAGRTGRCRTCGRRIIVPDGQQAPVAPQRPVPPKGSAASGSPTARRPVAATGAAVAKPAAASAGRGAVAAAQAGASPTEDLASGYELRAVTPVRVPAIELPDWEDHDLEVVIAPPPAAVPARPVSNESSSIFRTYRTFFNLLVQGTTWISETSYAVSLVILILSVAGGMIGRHSLAALGIRAIVVLNLVGLAGDIASLVNLSFRKDPIRGALFLVPPMTLYYLWSDWRRYRDTIGRMRIPLVTLFVVAVAHLFVPWLSGGDKDEGSVVATVERMIGDLEEKCGGQRGALEEGLKKARSWHREGALPDPPSPPPGVNGPGQPTPNRGP